MNRISLLGLSTSALLLLAPLPSCSSTPTPELSPEEMMAQWQEMNAPGEHQDHLKKLVGKFTTVNTMWMEPGAEPAVSRGTATNRMILDGRYLEGEYEGEIEGQPFTGRSLTGYDNMAQKYTNVWIDSMSTGVAISEGHCAKNGTVFTYTGEMQTGPGATQPYREVTTILDANSYKFEWFDVRDGKEMKSMEILYTRQR